MAPAMVQELPAVLRSQVRVAPAGSAVASPEKPTRIAIASLNPVRILGVLSSSVFFPFFIQKIPSPFRLPYQQQDAGHGHVQRERSIIRIVAGRSLPEARHSHAR